MIRKILILGNMNRLEVKKTALLIILYLIKYKIKPILSVLEFKYFTDNISYFNSHDIKFIDIFSCNEKIELIIVLGGDGTILHATEIGVKYTIPILGINLGHVGFLAESDKGDLLETIKHIVLKKYIIESRISLEIKIYNKKKLIYRDWALNEAAIEKSSNIRMIELSIAVDNYQLVTYICDGILVSTPTGSTAYAFSAGGPVIWPDVDAVLLVPLNAHTLFSKSLIISSKSKFSIKILSKNNGDAFLRCDGRRSFALNTGFRIELNQSIKKIKFIKLKKSTFTNKLVRKFKLPIHGWRRND